MKLIPVTINGKVYRLSERAMELLGLARLEKLPIDIQKLPPSLEIIKIQKKEPEKVAPVEVKKKEDVTVASISTPKRKSNGRKVGTKK
jgi:hypothetical protein